MALVSYRRAMELKPDSAGSHYNLGKILSELGVLDEAVVRYRKVIEIQPDFAMAYYNPGNAMNELGQYFTGYARLIEHRRGALSISAGRSGTMQVSISIIPKIRFVLPA